MNCYKTYETLKDGDGNYHTVEVWKPCSKGEPRDALRVNGKSPEVRNCVQVRKYVIDYFGGNRPGWRDVWTPVGEAEPDESERGGIRTNSNIKTGAVVSLNPERVREIFFSGCGEGITLQAMLQDPGKYAREWSAVKYVLTGEKEYKNEADKRWDEMLERMMDY